MAKRKRQTPLLVVNLSEDESRPSSPAASVVSAAAQHPSRKARFDVRFQTVVLSDAEVLGMWLLFH